MFGRLFGSLLGLHNEWTRNGLDTCGSDGSGEGSADRSELPVTSGKPVRISARRMVRN